MNKEELIDKLTDVRGVLGKQNRDKYMRGRDVGYENSIYLVKQLDKHVITEIPQFVADWIEIAKDVGITLVGVMDLDTITIYKSYPKVEFQNLKKYMVNGNNQKRVARAWLDGFTIEKETFYFIQEPITGQFLVKDKDLCNGVKWVDGFSTEPEYFTEKLIKAIDERYWSFATEVK